MKPRSISHRIANAKQLDRIAQPLRRQTRFLYHLVPVGVRNFLHGQKLGHPLHVVLVHLPVGGFTLAAIADLFGLRSVAEFAIAVSLVGMVVAAIPGLADWHVYDSPAVRRLGIAHALFNTVSIGLYVLAIVFRAAGIEGLGVLLSYLGFIALGISGYLGGVLVYEQRIGTNHAPAEDVNDGEEFVSVLPMADLVEDQPRRVQIGELPLALVLHQDEVHAFADSCAHQGGALSEGEVERGCLVCPWHGTGFRLGDGSVAWGPSAHAQPRFECRVRDGRVEVKVPVSLAASEEHETPHGRASLR